MKSNKPNFVLPQTKLCTVLWKRNGVMNKELIDTPRSNSELFNTMLMKHRVGFSEIRGVQSVDTDLMLSSFKPSFRR